MHLPRVGLYSALVRGLADREGSKSRSQMPFPQVGVGLLQDRGCSAWGGFALVLPSETGDIDSAKTGVPWL